jgi:effector-binding domain-containing protein
MVSRKKLSLVLGGLLFMLLLVGLLLPATARIERSADVSAHPATVFALVNDFGQIRKWSPLLDADANARFETAGPRRGAGASLAWNGSIIGAGSQTIVDSLPFKRVASELVLDGGGLARSTVSLEPGSTGTRVTLSFERDFGFNPFARYFGLLLEGIVSEDQLRGLDALKKLAESLPPSDFSDLEVEHMVVESGDIAYLPTSSEPLARAISEALGAAYFQVLSFIDEHGLQEAGAPISISRAYSGAELRFDAAVPVRGVKSGTAAAPDAVKLGKSYGGPVIRVKHVGSYLTLGRTHDKIAAYLAALGLERNGDAWEAYVSDPTRTPEIELLTYVYYPVQPER